MANKATIMEEEEGEFKWGPKKGGPKKLVREKNSDVQYYTSFTYKGELYSLYDCVYIHRDGAVETSIGKLVKIYETPSQKRMVKILWFLRPVEMRPHLGDIEVMWNELFLASGDGPGLANDNNVSVIIAKCYVDCISKGKRNSQAREVKSSDAEYIFYRTFDVGKQVISKIFPDEIAGIKVEFLLNGNKIRTVTHSPMRKQGEEIRKPFVIKFTKSTASPAKNSMPTRKTIITLKGLELQHRNSSEDPNFKRFPVSNGNLVGREIKDMSRVRLFEDNLPENTTDNSLPLKKRSKPLDGNDFSFQKKGPSNGNHVEENAIKSAERRETQLLYDRSPKTRNKFNEVTKRPDADRRNWFKKLPWDERLLEARDAGTLVSLENLDPTYTSLEVEDLVWHALKEKVHARMIESSTYSNPLYGKAFVIFKSKVAAKTAICELSRRCLVLGDGRSVLARRRNLVLHSKDTKLFRGHLKIEDRKFQRQSFDMKNAVSTAHCSQPNTIEYEFALQWLELYEISELQKETLYQEQLKQINEVKSKLNLKENS